MHFKNQETPRHNSRNLLLVAEYVLINPHLTSLRFESFKCSTDEAIGKFALALKALPSVHTLHFENCFGDLAWFNIAE